VKACIAFSVCSTGTSAQARRAGRAPGRRPRSRAPSRARAAPCPATRRPSAAREERQDPTLEALLEPANPRAADGDGAAAHREASRLRAAASARSGSASGRTSPGTRTSWPRWSVS
jgi:hypothetical protein